MRERELKFRVHGQYELPSLVGVDGVAAVDPPQRQALSATYLDTADLRLARWGVTLRRRTGGTDDGWHLKLPTAVPSERDEIQVLSDDPDVPLQLRELVTAFVRFAEIRDVATMTTDRTVHLLRDEDGTAVAELVDDVVAVLNGSHVTATFREIEIEDKGGGAALLDAVGAAVSAGGAVGGEFVPKVVRALGPGATATADPPEPGKVTVDDPARLAITAILRRYVRQFLANDPRVRRHEEDAVHQMRVAARRLRGALRTFAPLLDGDHRHHLDAELRWIAQELGAARDGEVLLSRLERAVDALPPELVLGPVRARIQQTVGGDLSRAQSEVSEVLTTERYIQLLDSLVDAAWSPRTTAAAEQPAGEALPPLVKAAWASLAKRARRLSQPDAEEEDYHRTRIAAKRTRYAAEAVAPVLGKKAKEFAARVEQVQEVLGEHQDAVVARDLLHHLARAPRAGTMGFTLGLLYAGEQRAAADCRAAFHEMWPEISSRRHRRWLDS